MAHPGRRADELQELIVKLEDLLAEVIREQHNNEDAPPEEEDTTRLHKEKAIQFKLMEMCSWLNNDEESYLDEDGDRSRGGAAGMESVTNGEPVRRGNSVQEELALDPENLDCIEPRDVEGTPRALPMSGNSQAAATCFKLATSSMLTRNMATAMVRICATIFRTPKSPADPNHRPFFSDQINALAAQLVAEIGRTELGRDVALKENIVSLLHFILGPLQPPQSQSPGPHQPQDDAGSGWNCSMETAVQVCRLLGNLSYEGGQCQAMVVAHNDQLLPRLIQLASDRSLQAKQDPGQRLPVVMPGFLLNFCNHTPEMIQHIGRLGFIDLIIQNILSTRTNDAVFNVSLNFFVCICDNLDMSTPFLLASADLPKAIDHILECTTSPEVSQTAFEMLLSLAHCPKLILHLASYTQLFQTCVHHIVGKWTGSSDYTEIRNSAIKLLIFMLAQDDCMKVLYSYQQGIFITTFTDWLSSEDVQLQVAGATCLANFACDETISLHMLSSDLPIASLMIKMLDTRVNAPNEFNLHHAILGALRNLSVTPAARHILIQKGIVAPCLNLATHLSMDTPFHQLVASKLLCTVRLLVDGHPEAVEQFMVGHVQEASQGSQVLPILVSWSSDVDAPIHIKSEVGRLLAALIKNSQSKKMMRPIVTEGGLPSVIEMLRSVHVKMMNEALVSLTILSAALVSSPDTEDGELVHRHLHSEAVISAIKDCLLNSDSSSVPIEVKKNALTFLSTLMKTHPEDLKQMLQQIHFSQDCSHFAQEHPFPEEEFALLAKQL